MEKVNRRKKREKSFERDVLDRLTIIETKIDDYSRIKDKSENAEVRSIQNEKDINEIKDKIKWLSRTIGVAIIGLLVEVVVFVIKMM